MKLELFNRKGCRSGAPKVTITRTGQIGLNSSSLQSFFKGVSNVMLYGDREKKIIGIKPIDREQDNSFKISFSLGKTTGSISGHSFLKYLKVDFTKTQKFNPQWDENEGMLIVKLN